MDAERSVKEHTESIGGSMEQGPDDYVGKNVEVSDAASGAADTALIPEERLRLAENILERCGAVPTDLNARNRELLGQRMTYRYGDLFYRIDSADFDGKCFLILSCADSERFAEIGLMEDVEAIDPGLPEEGIESVIRAALGADAHVRKDQ